MVDAADLPVVAPGRGLADALERLRGSHLDGLPGPRRSGARRRPDSPLDRGSPRAGEVPTAQRREPVTARRALAPGGRVSAAPAVEEARAAVLAADRRPDRPEVVYRPSAAAASSPRR